MRQRGSGRFSPLPASPLSKGRRPPIPPSLLPALRLSWPPFLWVSPSFGRTFSWLLFLRISSTTSFSPSFLLLSSFSFSLPLSYLFSSLPWLASIKSYETTNPPVGARAIQPPGLCLGELNSFPPLPIRPKLKGPSPKCAHLRVGTRSLHF